MRIAKKWFNDEGQPFQDIAGHPGIKHIAALVGHHATNKDQWLIFELGGRSLSKLLFDVKGEFYKGERIYAVGFFKVEKLTNFRPENRNSIIL